MPTHVTKPILKCHDCASSDVETAPGFDAVCRVTSDCKPWPAGGVLARCRACGLVQTAATPQWQADADRIYAGYTVYHQSGGLEQPVFNAATGAGRSRSDVLVEALLRHVALPAEGRLLDIGCGNGAFLRAFGKAVGHWRMCGSEVGDRYRDVVEAIPGVEGFFSSSLEGIPGQFDLISLVHVIEHIPGPTGFLRSLAERLKHGGLLLLEVPDCRTNSFMLMVADHCSHFSSSMLACVAARAGFTPLEATSQWVPKEISVVSRLTKAAPELPPASATDQEEVFQGWATLQRILAQSEGIQRRPDFGIFGTSIAATWLDTQLRQAAKYFVDEDPHRVGKQHFGRPILAPAQVPKGGCLFVALPAPIAGSIVARLKATRPDLELVSP